VFREFVREDRAEYVRPLTIRSVPEEESSISEAEAASQPCGQSKMIEDRGLWKNRVFRVARNMLFRTRSPDRDLRNDVQRLEAIARVANSAVLSAQREKRGLDQRLQSVSVLAASIVGNDLYEYQDRNASEEEALRSAEKELVRASARSVALSAHISDLEHLACAVAGMIANLHRNASASNRDGAASNPDKDAASVAELSR
jgi:hypothetical protein